MAKLNTDTSIVDYLKSQGKDSSYSARKQIASSMGITNYSGTASQNTQMLKTLKSQESASKNTITETKAEPKAETKVEPKAETPVTTNNIKGVSDEVSQKLNSSFTQSDESIARDKAVGDALQNFTNIASKGSIVSGSVYDILGSPFQVPPEVTEADAYLKQQLEKIQSGKTSYTDQIKDMMDKIVNREKFSYDVDTDPLFQQALSSAMKSGNQAMQDTIGQASALTGGYGSTYATSAGNQAYNSFIEDAYDNLPQYYQMALEAYQLEGEEMYRQLDMYNTADDKEYGRYVTAYDATSQYRNRLYDEAYSIFRDGKADAVSTANLQLQEHGQLSSDAYNLFNATSNYADSQYEREYSSWYDSINIAMQQAQMQNSDYWNDSNQKFQASESEKQREWQSSENQTDRDWKTSEAEKERNFTASENAKNRAVKSSGGGGGLGSEKELSEYKQTALEKYDTGGQKEYDKYLDSLPSDVDVEAIAGYVFGYEDEDGNKVDGYGGLPISERTYTVVDDGGWNLFGIDDNMVVRDQYDNEYTLAELREIDEELAKELSKNSYKVGSTYTKKSK